METPADSVDSASLVPCSVSAPCQVTHSHYIAIPPKRWNGTDRLNVAMWLHGYGRSAQVVAKNRRLLEVFDQSNTLLLVPSGKNKTWAFPGAPAEGRDDVGFIEKVVEHATRRFPIDRSNMTALGFSQGGSFVWTLACEKPNLFHRYVAFAGGFWRPHPKQCKDGPIDLVHIHGLKDTVVPLKGRAIGYRWHQGDIEKGLAFWRKSKQCAPVTSLVSAPASLQCDAAKTCGETSNTIVSCLHNGGHKFSADWVAWALDVDAN